MRLENGHLIETYFRLTGSVDGSVFLLDVTKEVDISIGSARNWTLDTGKMGVFQNATSQKKTIVTYPHLITCKSINRHVDTTNIELLLSSIVLRGPITA